MANSQAQFKPRANVIYVVDSESEQTGSNSGDAQCFKRSASAGKRRGSAKFKNALRTPPLARKKKNQVEAASSHSSSIELTNSATNSSHIKKTPDKKLNNVPNFSRTHCLKFLVFGCTLVILLVNFGLLALGTFLKADLTFSQFLSENYRQATETQFTAPSLYKGTYALIVLSALAIVVSVTGCCGAIRNNVCMLSTHFGILLVLFFSQLSVGILWYFRREAIENEVAVALDYMVQHYYQGPGIVQEVLDSLQTIFRCCGNAGCGDFVALRLTPPRTCDLDCLGCRDRMFRFIRDGMIVIYTFGFFMLLAEFISVVAVALLICRLKEGPSNQKATVYEIKVRDYDEKGKPVLVAEKSSMPPPIDRSDDGVKNDKVVYLAYPVHSLPRQRGKNMQ